MNNLFDILFLSIRVAGSIILIALVFDIDLVRAVFDWLKKPQKYTMPQWMIDDRNAILAAIRRPSKPKTISYWRDGWHTVMAANGMSGEDHKTIDDYCIVCKSMRHTNTYEI